LNKYLELDEEIIDKILLLLKKSDEKFIIYKHFLEIIKDPNSLEKNVI